MCGIIGAFETNNVSNLIIEGLRKLEYRGYDSAGISIKNGEEINKIKVVGSLDVLVNELNKTTLIGNLGIGHIRWATHGKPTVENAHPFSTTKVHIVHNGIIENYMPIKEKLIKKGYSFIGNTDSEVIAVLLHDILLETTDSIKAIETLIEQIDGAYALAILINGEDKIFFARNKSPIVVGNGENGSYIGSDASAISGYAKYVIYLENGDYGYITKDNTIIFNNKNKVNREKVKIDITSEQITKEGYEHFMLKEIMEQPKVIEKTVSKYTKDKKSVTIDTNINLKEIKNIHIIACGTSYNAGLVAQYQIEKMAKIPVSISFASEFRYRELAMNKDTLCLFISQSGETADTLGAITHAKSYNAKILSIVNNNKSSMARESDSILHTEAGTEVGVASTKAFTTQLAMLLLFAIHIAKVRGEISNDTEEKIIRDLFTSTKKIESFLTHDESVKKAANLLKKYHNALYLGRAEMFALAIEGSLKLKEISYIHAEGLAAGEMKHGHIALIDDNMPVIGLLPPNILHEKTLSNLQEVLARGAKLIVLTSEEIANDVKEMADSIIILPNSNNYVTPIIYSVALQLLAYYTATALGTNVDKPRNLAKSVTVE